MKKLRVVMSDFANDKIGNILYIIYKICRAFIIWYHEDDE